ncbi:hypothetical protein LXA43DRAFT_1124803 [Ganoderma leucocontextum]|nr:hypothetical protein LXA43DRAFT_1124803 [Ganoderma leucocontextum]
MSHFFPAYIGKPPPHVLRKRRQREREERAREEWDRELSPVVPDPEPSTPAHDGGVNVFGTPTRSVSCGHKTYAHKRARSFTTSHAGAGSDGEQEQRSSSREPSSSRSPTKVVWKKHAHDNDPTRLAKRPRFNENDDNDMYADPLVFAGHDAIAPAASSSRSPMRHRKASVYVEIQTPVRRSRSQAQQDVRVGSPEVPAPPPNTRRPRGRPPKVKPIAIPIPSTASDEGAAQNVKHRRHTSGPEMTVGEALNQSFALSIASSSPAASSSRARRAGDENKEIADPSRPEPVPIKRGPGRPRGSGRGRGRGGGRGRGRGRGAASSLSLVSHDADNAPPPARAHGSEASLPTWTTLSTLNRADASSRRPPPAFAPEEEESSSDELASVAQAPAKRTPGRPRKHPLEKASTSAAPVDAYGVRPPTPGPSTNAAETPTKRRGRPPCSKNKATLDRETAAAAMARGRASLPGALPALSASIMTSYPAVPGPPLATPVKRGHGRPRKSAPAPSVFGLDTIDYMEPLKDPDDPPNPFRRRTRSQSRQGRGSTSGTPAASPVPSPRHDDAEAAARAFCVRVAGEASGSICAGGEREAVEGDGAPDADAIVQRAEAHAAPMPKLKDVAAENEKQKRKQLKEKERQKRKRNADRLPDDVLFFGGDKSEGGHDDGEDKEEQGDATARFCGSWSVLADPAATFDD